jgi:hypothetical protein
MPFPLIPLAISGISALAGGLLNKDKTEEQKQTTNKAGDSSAYGINRPVYDPAEDTLRYNLLSRYLENLSNDQNLQGYQAQGISNINRNAGIRTQAIRDSLASRGFSHSPIAAFAPAQSESARISDISSFQNSIPLLARQLYDSRLQAAGGFLQSLPKGAYNTQDSTYHEGSSSIGTGTQQGSPLGGGIGSLAEVLAGLYGRSNAAKTAF